MHPQLLYNDRIVPADEAVLRAGQLGLLAGWGVFSTLRIHLGVPFAFERHWRRIERDAKKLHVSLQRYEIEAVRRQLLELVAANATPEASMRLCIVRSEGGVWQGPGSGRESDLLAFSTPGKSWKDRVALSVTEHGRHAASAFAGTKTLSWSHNLTMAETAARAGFDETILLNEHGEVAECTSANIFALLDGCVCTPPLASGPLPGVTREVLLEELGSNGAAVQERTLTLEDLYAADEVFITSSNRGLLSVERIGARRLRAESWPVMEQLRDRFQDYVADYCRQRQA